MMEHKYERLPRSPFVRLALEEYGVCAFTGDLLSIPCRARERVPDGARSVIVAAFPYYVGAFAYRNVSRYAMADDYHAATGALLRKLCADLASEYPGEAFEPFIDSSPLDEVEAGVRAGLGVRGLHGQLINPRYGSYIFIGEIVTTLRLRPGVPLQAGRVGCLRCGLCAARCPSGAIAEIPAPLRRELCLSHLTQKKKLTDAAEIEAVRAGRLIWGCDVCGDVCPMNRGALYSPLRVFYRNICAVVTDNNFDRVFTGRAWCWRGRAVLWRNLQLIEGKRQ